jgi:hypothetical protein
MFVSDRDKNKVLEDDKKEENKPDSPGSRSKSPSSESSSVSFFHWFSPYNDQDIMEYRLIGSLLGLGLHLLLCMSEITVILAIYNSVILDLHFPHAVYKKLLNYECDLNDLFEFQPQVAMSLRVCYTLLFNIICV